MHGFMNVKFGEKCRGERNALCEGVNKFVTAFNIYCPIWVNSSQHLWQKTKQHGADQGGMPKHEGRVFLQKIMAN
jgi:hypothetical protein